jgi:asparagine N-glycosylation enzyme membrane subunit Stt3
MSAPRWRIREGAAFVLLVLIWTLLRVVPSLPHVLPGPGETVLLGNDPWFHLHQLTGAVEHFPRILRWDVGTLYPEGSRVAAAGLLHLGLATVAKGLGLAATETDALAFLLAVSPVVLGAASLGFLFLLAREIGGRRLAWATLIVRIVFPGGELERTLFGFGDQHAAEILLVTASLWAWVRWTRVGAGDRTSLGKLVAGGVFAALPVAVFLFTWFGAPLFLATLIVSFWMVEGVAIGQGRREPVHAAAIACFAGILAITAIVGWLWREGIMVPEAWRFSLAALAVQVALMFVVKTMTDRSRGPVRPIAALGVLSGLLVLVAGGFLFLNPRVIFLAGHFLGPANRGISEHALGPQQVWWWDYGLLLPWLVLGIGWGVIHAHSKAHRTVFAVIGCWVLLASLRSDFFYLTGALSPLAIAFGATRFREMMSARGRFRIALLPEVCAGLTLLLAAPVGWLRAPYITRGEVAPLVVATRPWREAMAWLKDDTEVSALSPTALVEPWRKRDGFAYPPGTGAVFTHWQYGNLVPTLARRIAVSARSRSPEFIEWYLESNEESSHLRLGAVEGIRYLVLDAVSACDLFATEALQAGVRAADLQVADGAVWQGVPLKSYGEPFRRSIGANLYLGDGTAMERYRLVHESRDQAFVRYRLLAEEGLVSMRSDLVGADSDPDVDAFRPLTGTGEVWREEGGYTCYSGQLLPAVKVFERVAGAVLQGEFAPGETVSLELRHVVPGSGREIVYRREGVAGVDGRVKFRVPYATAAASPYRITPSGPGAVEKQVTVGEAQVTTGATIDF